MKFPPGSVKLVKASDSDPARLPHRGGVLFTTLPSIKVPAGRTTRAFNSTGSSKRACTTSPDLLFDVLTSPSRRILHCVPVGRSARARASGEPRSDSVSREEASSPNRSEEHTSELQSHSFP